MKREKGKVMVLGTVRGLVSEIEKVNTAYDSFQPDTIAISVSEEGLQAMKEHLDSLKKKNEELEKNVDMGKTGGLEKGEKPDEGEDGEEAVGLDNIEEEYYVRILSQWGEVRKPPPCFVRAWELAGANDLPIHAIDFNDVEFTDIYCHHVNGVEWLKQPAMQRKLARKKFEAKTPEEFAAEWDGFINGSGGLRAIEDSRVKKMASEINELSKRSDRVMVVIELERLDEVISELEGSGCRLF